MLNGLVFEFCLLIRGVLGVRPVVGSHIRDGAAEERIVFQRTCVFFREEMRMAQGIVYSTGSKTPKAFSTASRP